MKAPKTPHVPIVIGGLLLSLSSLVHAQSQPCSPLSTYHVSGISAQHLPADQAISMLFTGTPWQVTVSGTLPHTTLSYSNVSGPLDEVLAQAVERVGQAVAAPLAAVSDPARCLVTLSLPSSPAVQSDKITQTTAITEITHAQASSVLPAGESLSEALEAYAKQQGWTLRWNIEDDYMLDVDLPLPDGGLINTITWVVNTYQSQGGLRGVAPRFAQSNRVVVIEHMNVRESN